MTQNKLRILRLAAGLMISLLLSVANAAFAQSNSFRMPKATAGALAVRTTLDQDGQSIDISTLGTVGGLSISGQVSLSSEMGYVRVILETTDGDEHLVYEANNLLVTASGFTMREVCEETCSLGSVGVSALRVELQFASVEIDVVTVASADATPAGLQRASTAARALRASQLGEKVRHVQGQIAAKGYRWVAGETPIAALTYAEKKRLFLGPMTNLYGFEYYKGGVFELPIGGARTGVAPSRASSSPYVRAFSWHDRHGQDWLTSVKNQGGCGSCWAFAATAATELLANIYYNRHLNLDLSEQDGLSCSGAGSCNGGFPNMTLAYFAENGVVDESCFPYSAWDQPCSDKCASPAERIRIAGYTDFDSFNRTEDDLKAMLLRGAVSGGIYWWSHAMVLLGYRELAVGDELFVNAPPVFGQIVLGEGDPLVGRVAWRFKNSWGREWGDAGYAYVVTDISQLGWTAALHGPITSTSHSPLDVVCEDRDHDGYFQWGVGEIPPTCPRSISLQSDGNDADHCLGPMDAYGHMTSLCGTSLPLRIDAGSTQEYVDQSGHRWQADAHYLDGTSFRRGAIEIERTDDDVLYQTERFGVSRYSAPVPNGRYTVRLHFAETYDGITGPGQRVFRVQVEGGDGREVDVYARTGGRNRALVLRYDVDVTDNALDVNFVPIVQNTLINAIEVSEREPPDSIRIDAGAVRSYRDSLGRLWSADAYYADGIGFDRGGIAIEDSEDDRLYQTERFGVTRYGIPVANGLYTIRLHFAETYAGITAPGQRVFRLRAEEVNLGEIDVFEGAGGLNRAFVVQAYVRVRDEQLDLAFEPIVQNTLINAIEIVPPVSRSELRVDTGSARVTTDAFGRRWERDFGFQGGTPYDRGDVPIGNTETPRIYQTERFGMTSYEFDLPNGLYWVGTHFAETYEGITGPGQRVFDFSLNDVSYPNFDVYAMAGFRNALVWYTMVTVTDHRLSLRFRPITQNTLVNGIEITPW